MSSLSMSDLVFSTDVLSETKFEPWWEILRSYCMRVLVAISLITFYVTHVAKPIRCISTHRSNISISTQENLFINSYCLSQIEWYIRNFGIIVLFCSALLFLTFQSWLFFPSVGDAFRTIRHVDDRIGESKLSKADIERLAVFPRTKQEEDGEIGHLCSKIFHRDLGLFPVSTLYRLRNVTAAVVLLIYASLSWVVFGSGVNEDKTFECDVGHKVESVVGPEKYLCSNDLRLGLAPYEFTYAVTCTLLLFILIYLLRRTATAEANVFSSDSAEKLSDDITQYDRDHSFIKFFAKHSHSMHKATETLLNLTSRSCLELMEEKGIGEAVQCLEHDYIKLFMRLHRYGEKCLVDEMKKRKPWTEPYFNERIFHIPEVFKVAMRLKEFRLVCDLHHHALKAHSKHTFNGCGCQEIKWSLIDKRNGQGENGTANDKENHRAEGNEQTSKKAKTEKPARGEEPAKNQKEGAGKRKKPAKSRERGDSRALLHNMGKNNRNTSPNDETPGEDNRSFITYICDNRYDGKFSAAVVEHFLSNSSKEDRKNVIGHKVNGTRWNAWLHSMKETVILTETVESRENWNDFLKVLLKYDLVTKDERDQLKLEGSRSDANDKPGISEDKSYRRENTSTLQTIVYSVGETSRVFISPDASQSTCSSTVRSVSD